VDRVRPCYTSAKPIEYFSKFRSDVLF